MNRKRKVRHQTEKTGFQIPGLLEGPSPSVTKEGKITERIQGGV